MLFSSSFNALARTYEKIGGTLKECGDKIADFLDRSFRELSIRKSDARNAAKADEQLRKILDWAHTGALRRLYGFATKYENDLLGFEDERPEALTSINAALRKAIELQCKEAGVPVPHLGVANYDFSIRNGRMATVLAVNMRAENAVKIMKNIDYAKGVELERNMRRKHGKDLSNFDFPFAFMVDARFIDARTGKDATGKTRDEDMRMKVEVSTTLNGKKMVTLESRGKSRYGFQEDFAKTCLELIAAANGNLSNASVRKHEGGRDGVEEIIRAGTKGSQKWKIRGIVSAAMVVRSWPMIAMYVSKIGTALAFSSTLPLLPLAGLAISSPRIFKFCKRIHDNFKSCENSAMKGDNLAKRSIWSFCKSVADEFVHAANNAARVMGAPKVIEEKIMDKNHVDAICDTGRRIRRTRLEKEGQRRLACQRM